MDWSNKEQVLEEIGKNGAERFQYASEELKNDFGFVLRAYALDSDLLQYVKEEYADMIGMVAMRILHEQDLREQYEDKNGVKVAEEDVDTESRIEKDVIEAFKQYMDGTGFDSTLFFGNADFWRQNYDIQTIMKDIEKCKFGNDFHGQKCSQENLEQLSTEELENMLNATTKDNDSKRAELENLKRKELIDKIIAAQKEGQDLDRQITDVKAKGVESK